MKRGFFTYVVVAWLLTCGMHAVAAAPTFSKDVAPILLNHCVQCHRPGGIASMAPFISYESVRTEAGAIQDAVTRRWMPPWSADPRHSLKFRNDPRLSDSEIATVKAWVHAGALQGDDSAALNLPALAGEWRRPGGRKPDLVISMNKDVVVPAHGDLPYLRFLVQLPLHEDKWVEASQARPGNASVVHHMAITEVELPEGVPNGDLDGLEAFYRRMGIATPLLRPAVGPQGTDLIDMLGIYTPGTTLEEYGDDSAKLLKGGKNRYIDFNIHYSGRGAPATDRSEVAFWFRDTAPRHQIYRVAMSGGTILANGEELLPDTPGEKAEGTHVFIPPIPPGAPDYEVVGITAFAQPVTIFQLHPHAHFRAKDFQYVIVDPEGHEESILSVPKYDFHWQLAYELATPLKVAAGSKLVVTAHYDNSARNEMNPAPQEKVSFLAQNRSTDEMFSPFMQYSVDTEHPDRPSASPRNDAGWPTLQSTGCLRRSGTGSWVLAEATAPESTAVDAPGAAELGRVATSTKGNARVMLIGVAPFRPEDHVGEKVFVKGLATADRRGLNVTSLLKIPGSCP